jgi:hypothetical protein
MLRKFLSLLFGLGFVLNSAASGIEKQSPFEFSSLGKCFENTDSFVRNALGEPALNDPNLIRSKEGSWIWIVDQTPSKNYTWYLLEKAGDKTCLRAFLPAASEVKFNGKSFGRLDAFIAPESGFPAKLIQLRARSRSEIFQPFRCYVLATGLRAGPRKQMPCGKILD